MYAATDTRGTWALVVGMAGIAIGLLGLLAGAVVLLSVGGDLTSTYFGSPELNGFGLGIPALALGPLAYFMARSSASRIAASEGKLGGRQMAGAASVLAVAATIIGAAATLGWLVITLLGYFGPPPA
jgi:hypothetical protein